MAAPISRWLRSKTTSVLLKFLCNQTKTGSKIKVTLPSNKSKLFDIKNNSEKYALASINSFTNGVPHKSHNPVTKTPSFQSQRPHSTGGNEPNDPPLRLMEFPERIWPHPIKTFKSFFLSFLMKGYIDHDFRPDIFLRGVEQAVGEVSKLISVGDFAALEALIDHQAVGEIRQNFNRLSPSQRKFIAVNTDDIFMKFVYEIGMIFDDESDERFVEITAVLQGFHGLEDARNNNPDTYTEIMQKSKEDVYVCNYRFIREYTKGKEDDWTINKLNHFRPIEIVNKTKWFDR